MPIELISQQSIGPSLGKESIDKSVKAGMIGFGLVILFMILIYRFGGFLASIALMIYAVMLLSLFKVIPVTLTLSGIAGFILSVGMAVDANILVFERLREEIKFKNQLKDKRNQLQQTDIDNAFSRAWLAIRDGNFTTLINCIWICARFFSNFVFGYFNKYVYCNDYYKAFYKNI